MPELVDAEQGVATQPESDTHGAFGCFCISDPGHTARPTTGITATCSFVSKRSECHVKQAMYYADYGMEGNIGAASMARAVQRDHHEAD